MKIVDGKLFKLCRGPYCLRENPNGKWIEINEKNFYFRKYKGRRQPRSYCKRCDCYYTHKRFGGDEIPHGLVPIQKIHPIIRELYDRIGQSETARRSGIRPASLWRIYQRTFGGVRRSTAEKLVNVLAEVRENKEQRTTKEIHFNKELREARKR